MNAIQAIVLAVLQGATELFPVSSLGHAVVLPALLNWNIDQRAAAFLPFLVMLHLGTATALLLYFWRDRCALLTGLLGARHAPQVREIRRVAWLIIVATITAVIVGFLLVHFVRVLVSDPETVDRSGSISSQGYMAAHDGKTFTKVGPVLSGHRAKDAKGVEFLEELLKEELKPAAPAKPPEKK